MDKPHPEHVLASDAFQPMYRSAHPEKISVFLLKCCIYRINVSCDVLMLFNSENKITVVGLRSKAILAVSVCLLVLNFP